MKEEKKEYFHENITIAQQTLDIWEVDDDFIEARNELSKTQPESNICLICRKNFKKGEKIILVPIQAQEVREYVCKKTVTVHKDCFIIKNKKVKL